jgi:hypothetical protein
MGNRYDDVMSAVGFKYRSDRVLPTEADIAEYELHIGFRLPEDFREFIRDYGEIAPPYGFRWQDDTGAGVEWIDGIHKDSRNDLRNMEGCGLPPGYIAIAEACGGQIVYSVGPENHGRVYWITLHEIPDDGSYRVTEADNCLAHSFDEFIRSLRAVKD